MISDPAAMRRDYAARGLTEEDLLGDPIAQFQSWFEDACRAEVFEPNAMTLATVGGDGQPSARVVLLKGLNERGLAFFTNLESRKAAQIA
ncbi:MAG TPA: pyridoxamine 5'-phosphate oxidase family protein, partial [Geminicoccaceae bacterium]|nr:pyridoxamine 5'-phosphate oxidase family protein [Geminicoccaceae bacterium]